MCCVERAQRVRGLRSEHAGFGRKGMWMRCSSGRHERQHKCHRVHNEDTIVQAK